MATNSPNFVAFLAAIASLLIAHLTLVRWTRDSRDQAIHELKRQFWIEHSTDVPYAVGSTASPAQSETRLIVRGLEIYEYGWYLEGHQTDPYPWRTNPREALRMKKNVMKAHLKKLAYYLYRTFVPFASLKMDCSLLIEAQNCQLSIWEHIEYDEHGQPGLHHGRQLPEEIDHLHSFSPLWDNLYKIGFGTYDYYEVDEALNQLKNSPFVKTTVEQQREKSA